MKKGIKMKKVFVAMVLAAAMAASAGYNEDMQALYGSKTGVTWQNENDAALAEATSPDALAAFVKDADAAAALLALSGAAIGAVSTFAGCSAGAGAATSGFVSTGAVSTSADLVSSAAGFVSASAGLAAVGAGAVRRPRCAGTTGASSSAPRGSRHAR